MPGRLLDPNAYSAAAVSAAVERCLEVLVIPVVGLVIVVRCLYGPDTGVGVWLLTLSVIYAALFLLGRAPAERLGRVDWALLAVILAETASYFNSTYRANSLRGYHETLFIFLFYCFVRLHLKHGRQQVGVFLLITLLGLYLSATALLSFQGQYAELASHGFDDMTDFRQILRAFRIGDYPAAEWVTLYLMLLPFPTLLFIRFAGAAPRAAWLLLCPAVLLLLVIAATFSRGLYIATAAFFVSSALLFRMYRLTALRRLVCFSAVSFLLFALFLCVTPLGPPTLKSAAMFSTTSQVRSLEGRAGASKAAWEIFKVHPLLGVGSFNFPMHYAAYKEEDAVFAGRAFNIFLQILVEKGVVGLLAYCLLFFAFFKASHEKMRRLGDDTFQKAVTAVLAAACVALLVRDLSYSSMLTNAGVSALLWFAFALNAGPAPVRAAAGPA